MRECCLDKTKVENYELAKAENFVNWQLHHRLETHFSDGTPRPLNAQLSVAELIALDMYYDRPPEEFIYMTRSEHQSLHHKGKQCCLGRHHSEETKQKLSKILSKPRKKGIRKSEEHKRKLSESLKGRTFSEETRRRMSEAAKNRKKNK